jgi:predicted nuclease of predicted toxin-antitoxin system
MNILVDMNLSPDWVEVLQRAGHDAVHWSSIGDVRARDSEILQVARERGQVVFTHDLDFAALIALTRQTGPSVVQVRTHDVMPQAIAELVVAVLEEHASDLQRGALVSIDESTARVRILPIK